MTELGRYTMRFNEWRRAISAAPLTSRTKILMDAADDLALLTTNGLDKQAAVDELQDIAEAYGMAQNDEDKDHVQWLFNEAFKKIEDVERVPWLEPEPDGNGHDARALLATFPAAIFKGLGVPLRRWLVEGWIPMRNVTLLSGDGATGKTTIALQLAVSCAVGRNDWFGGLIDESGPVLFLTAEEERDEVHYRLSKIVDYYQIEFAALTNLHIHCAAGEDCLLGNTNKLGLFHASERYEQLKILLATLHPKLVILESSADLYGGNENDRSSVRQFIRLLRALAIEFDCAVVLISHPSIAGLQSGTGTSGTTGWNNAVRSRLYFQYDKEKDDEEADTDFRLLKVMKANYAPKGGTTRLEYDDGIFRLPKTAAEYAKQKEEDQIDEVFLTILRRLTKQGRTVSDKPSVAYAPMVFASEPEAKKRKPRISKQQLADAMRRLFAAQQIGVGTKGSPSHLRGKIIEGSGPSNEASNVLQFPSNDLPTRATDCPPQTPPYEGVLGEEASNAGGSLGSSPRVESRDSQQEQSKQTIPHRSKNIPIAAWEIDELKLRGFTSDDLFSMNPAYARDILADPERNKLTERYGKGAAAPADTVCRVCKKQGARYFDEPRDLLAPGRTRMTMQYPLHLACCPRFFDSAMPIED